MSEQESLQTFANWFAQALPQDTRLRMNFERTRLSTAASATHQQHWTPSEKVALPAGAAEVRRWQRELLPSCWPAHVKLFGRCPYGPALHLLRSKVNPPGVSGEVQTSEGRQKHLMLTADVTGRLLPPVLWRFHVTTFWKNKISAERYYWATISVSRAMKSPFLYSGGNQGWFCWNQQCYKDVKPVKVRGQLSDNAVSLWAWQFFLLL